jgi:hypothetical protein
MPWQCMLALSMSALLSLRRLQLIFQPLHKMISSRLKNIDDPPPSYCFNQKPWTNFNCQDKPWAEFSTLEMAACHAMHLLHSIAIRPNLELKTQPKHLLGYLQLDIALPDST